MREFHSAIAGKTFTQSIIENSIIKKLIQIQNYVKSK